MKENSNNNTNVSKNKVKKKKAKIKTYLGRVIYHSNNKNTPIPIFVLGILVAVLLDTLTIIKNLIVSLFITIIAVTAIAGMLVWQKVEPIYNEYNTFAEEVVNNATYDSFKLQESSYIYDIDGKLICKLKADQDSSYISYSEIPSAFIDAFVAVEDRSFWDNSGVDFKGIARILYNFVKTGGEEVHGASTITQQLARNIFLTHEVSLERKAKEMLIAMKLTSKFTKEEIIEFYCNDICFANTYYGISAAAKGYFNKDINELTLSEICYLCAIPNSPEYYNPYKYPDRAVKRRDKILNDMYGEGLISEDELNEALNETIVIERPTYEFNDYISTYAIDCAIKYMMEASGFEFRYKFDNMDDYKNYYDTYDDAYEIAKNKLYTGGYKIYTSLSKDVQTRLQNILDEKLSFNENIDESTGIYMLQGAITAVDNENGKVIAVVGGRSQDTATQTYSLNRAFQAYRQPGSSIKPLVVYTPALMNGFTPNSTVYNISVTEAKKKDVEVQKLTGEAMTLRSALIYSKNGVAWQLFDKFGADYCLSFLNNMKFSRICPDDYYNSSSLGGLTYGVTTVEMACAYSTLVNHGEYRGTNCLLSIKDRNDNEIYKEAEPVQVYKVSAADTVVDIMQGVISEGTAASMGWQNVSKNAAAGKTGTTNDNKDIWFCGFTPYYTISVWVGYDTPKKMTGAEGKSSFTAKIWKDAMVELTSELDPITGFSRGDTSIDSIFGTETTISSDLPIEAYEKYMPGRDDSEELSTGYTVYDFRKDRVIGESVDIIINQLNSIDISDQATVQELYNQGCEIINTIYSVRYTHEKQNQLDEAYNLKKLQ